MRITSATDSIADVRPLRALALLLCVSTLALAASGCGGDEKSFSGTEPSTWAATVCGAVGDWTRGLQADSARLGAGLGGTADIKVVKARFVAFLANAERNTRTMVTRIRGAGAPAVKDGAKIQEDLVKGLEGAQAALTHAAAQAKKLPTSNPQAFQEGVQELGGDVQNELASVGSDFNTLGDKYKDSTLNKATTDEPACKNISA
jgi:hypothetical protein